MKPAKHTAHYISGTHWDREWYRPFQEYRVLLVRLLDGLLDLMERDEEFRHFQLDGQTCILQDYLEIRPENRGRLEKLVRAGRILVGPWFTMPDLFCVGDEALVRNLLLGRRIAREWGVDPMPVGFICDMFGHPSQMPQIFGGFGYRDCLLGRGTNEHTTPPFFEWEAPDGSRAFTFKLQDADGYGAFARPRVALEEELRGSAPKELLEELAAAGGDPARAREVREKWFRKLLKDYVGHEVARANAPVLCLMDSMDHIPPATEVARYLRLIREACPGVSPRHSTLPAFFKAARRAAGKVPVRRGELREPSREKCGYLWLIPYCVSARVRLKQANDAGQALLEKWADPFTALANLEGAGIPERHLRVAWTHLLTNHAHDSICGCSIDQVHRDMGYRFDQARVLGEQLRAQALGALTAASAGLAKGKDEFTLTVANPLPRARDEVVTFDVDLPPDWPTDFAEGFHAERWKSFLIEDAGGKNVPYQRLRFVPRMAERSRHARFWYIHGGEFARYTVAARLRLPALGYASFRVRPSPRAVRAPGTLRTGPTAAENERLAIAVEANGTLALTDKASGETWTGLLLLEDRSDVGDGWFHSASLNDEQALSSAGPAQLSVAHEGPELVAFRIEATLSLPRRHGAKERAPLVVSSVVTLRRGSRVVEVETSVDNAVEDHRLRVLFPTDAAGAKAWFAQEPFDFVERKIALDASTADWQEAEIPEKPFLHAQAVGSGKRGLAFLSAGGLHEGGVRDDARRTMQVTLLRSFRQTVGTSGERDGLELGEVRHRYALMPYSGELPRGAICDEVARLQGGVFTRQTGARSSGFPEMEGEAPATRGFVELAKGALQVSAIKAAEDGKGLIVRLWNPTGKAQKDALKFWRAPAAAEQVRLDETGGERLAVDGATVGVEAAPHRIVTVRVRFGRGGRP
jgi:alpha-mannosidase/mannosylglycerate hydrolase